MILQVHDELDFECPASEVDALVAMVREEMEGVAQLRVPSSRTPASARPGRGEVALCDIAVFPPSYRESLDFVTSSRRPE